MNVKNHSCQDAEQLAFFAEATSVLVLVLWEMLHAVSSQTLALRAGNSIHIIYRESQNEKHQQT